MARSSPQAEVDGIVTGQEPSESPKQDTNGDERKTAKTSSRLSSRETSCSSERAASTILEPAAMAEQVATEEQTVVVSKEKKVEKRPSATRRSVKMFCANVSQVGTKNNLMLTFTHFWEN